MGEDVGRRRKDGTRAMRSGLRWCFVREAIPRMVRGVRRHDGREGSADVVVVCRGRGGSSRSCRSKPSPFSVSSVGEVGGEARVEEEEANECSDDESDWLYVESR